MIEEFEFKLAFDDPALLDTIPADPAVVALALPGSRRDDLLDTTYYDTADRALRKARLTYRIRKDGHTRVATMKAGGSVRADGAHIREEWTIEAPAGFPWPDDVRRAGLVDGIDPAALLPLFRTLIRRTALTLAPASGGTLELAADRCVIEANDGRTTEFFEIEIELKGAAPDEAARLAAHLTEKYGLRPEAKSKFARGIEFTR